MSTCRRPSDRVRGARSGEDVAEHHFERRRPRPHPIASPPAAATESWTKSSSASTAPVTRLPLRAVGDGRRWLIPAAPSRPQTAVTLGGTKYSTSRSNRRGRSPVWSTARSRPSLESHAPFGGASGAGKPWPACKSSGHALAGSNPASPIRPQPRIDRPSFDRSCSLAADRRSSGRSIELDDSRRRRFERRRLSIGDRSAERRRPGARDPRAHRADGPAAVSLGAGGRRLSPRAASRAETPAVSTCSSTRGPQVWVGRPDRHEIGNQDSRGHRRPGRDRHRGRERIGERRAPRGGAPERDRRAHRRPDGLRAQPSHDAADHARARRARDLVHQQHRLEPALLPVARRLSHRPVPAQLRRLRQRARLLGADRQELDPLLLASGRRLSHRPRRPLPAQLRPARASRAEL